MILHIFLCGVNFNLWITTVVHSLIQSYNSFSFPSIWHSLSVKKNILWTKQLTKCIATDMCRGKNFFFMLSLCLSSLVSVFLLGKENNENLAVLRYIFLPFCAFPSFIFFLLFHILTLSWAAFAFVYEHYLCRLWIFWSGKMAGNSGKLYSIFF